MRDRGFTLIELTVVIVIIGILAAIVAPRLVGRAEKAKRTQAGVQIQNFETALRLFKMDNGFYPSTEQGLAALVEMPTTGEMPKSFRKGGYLEKSKVPADPWGRPYIYVSPGVHGEFDMLSLGQDGLEGGDGPAADINNWELK